MCLITSAAKSTPIENLQGFANESAVQDSQNLVCTALCMYKKGCHHCHACLHCESVWWTNGNDLRGTLQSHHRMAFRATVESQRVWREKGLSRHCRVTDFVTNWSMPFWVLGNVVQTSLPNVELQIHLQNPVKCWESHGNVFGIIKYCKEKNIFLWPNYMFNSTYF